MISMKCTKKLQITHIYYYIHNTKNGHSKYSKKISKDNYHEIATSQIQFHCIFNNLHLGFETSSKHSRLFSLDILNQKPFYKHLKIKQKK
jgi:hypothetical protein